MLKNIKSSFIMKKIFINLYDRIQLKIIKYNKSLQNRININLNNYKIFSVRYIIYETNIKGKEYDYNDELLFEGEYLNGSKNGRGKEYYSEGNLKFEGEYLNGLKWNGKGYDINNNIVYELNNGKGYVKEYKICGKLVFEGEYLNGIKNGKGKEYDYYGNLIFEGEYLNGFKVFK